jgi:hypothetical protein
MIFGSFESCRNRGDESFVQSALKIFLERLREFKKLQKKNSLTLSTVFEFRFPFENPSHNQNMLFSAIFKTHASAQGEIWNADWTKLSSPRFRPLLKLANIMKINILRRFS